MKRRQRNGGAGRSRRTVLRAATTGAAAAALGVGASGTAAAQSGKFDGWMEDARNYDGSVVDETGKSEVTVSVGAGKNGLAFGPAVVRVDPGTKIVWEWTGEGGSHNVVGENVDFESGSPVQQAGTTYEKTFEEKGVVKYFCLPHKTVGMKGVVVVGDVSLSSGGGGSGGDADGGGGLTGRMIGITGALVLAVVAPIALSLFGARSASAGTAEETLEGIDPSDDEYVTKEAPAEEPEVEIGHHDYDPTGTWTLVLIYFAILVLLWVFMYFVEFLGNGPTIIG